MGFTSEHVEQVVKENEPYDTFSFLQGFLACVRKFGVWNEGEQRIGVEEHTIRSIALAIDKYIEEQL